MQTPQVQTCKDCNLIQELIEKLDLKLWELAERDWNAIKFNLETPRIQDITGDLIRYKRILTKRTQNPSYPCSDYTTQDIAKKLLGKVYTGKRCLCFSVPPSPTSTTTTTTTTLI